MKYEIARATEAHARDLAENMREADVAEAVASGFSSPLEAVLKPLTASRDTWVGLADGKVLCMFGTQPLTIVSSRACVWMLTTHEVPKHFRVFLRVGREIVRRELIRYTELWNMVDARHATAIRWLTWMGAEIFPAIPFGPGLPFHPFVFRSR